jgi:hypothetical protein
MNHSAGSATGTDLDLDKLEALARAATPGPWQVLTDEHVTYAEAYTHKERRIFTVDQNAQLGSIYPVVNSSRGIAANRGDPPIWMVSIEQQNADFIAAANPAAVLELIAATRRAPQPSADRAPADGAPERFYMDHCVWHDRETGQHLWTQDQYDEQWRDMYKAGQEHAAIGYNMLGGRVITAPTAAPADGAGVKFLSLEQQAGLLTSWLKSGACAQVDGQKLRDDILQWLQNGVISPAAPAAGDSPSPQPGVDEAIADDPDDDPVFTKWREDSGVDVGDKWVAWSAWCGALALRAALTRRAPPAMCQPGPDIYQPAAAMCQPAATTASASEHQGAAQAQAGEEDALPLADYAKWIEGRGALGPGAVPERVFFAGWFAGNRAAMAAPAQRNGSDQ